MARRALVAVAAAIAVLALAACGSSHHPPKTVNPGGPNIPATSSSPVNPGGPNIPASSSTSATTSTASTSTAPATGSSTTSTTTASHPAPRGGAHLDARFDLGSDGAVTPAQVMLPSGVPIVLQLGNGDSRTHTVSLAGATHSSVRLPADGHASEPIGRLHKGTYGLLVDGHAEAHLVIGVAPGP